MEKEQVLFAHDLFVPDNGGTLLASECEACGKKFFPKKNRCLSCFSNNMKEIMLEGDGKLYTYTIVQMPTYKYPPPFAIGWIELPEGIRIMGQLKNWENRDLKIGMAANLIVDVLWEEDGKEFIGYKFDLE